MLTFLNLATAASSMPDSTNEPAAVKSEWRLVELAIHQPSIFHFVGGSLEVIWALDTFLSCKTFEATQLFTQLADQCNNFFQVWHFL